MFSTVVFIVHNYYSIQVNFKIFYKLKCSNILTITIIYYLCLFFFFFCLFDVTKNNHKNENKNSSLVKQTRIIVRIFKKKLFQTRKRTHLPCLIDSITFLF